MSQHMSASEWEYRIKRMDYMDYTFDWVRNQCNGRRLPTRFGRLLIKFRMHLMNDPAEMAVSFSRCPENERTFQNLIQLHLWGRAATFAFSVLRDQDRNFANLLNYTGVFDCQLYAEFCFRSLIISDLTYNNLEQYARYIEDHSRNGFTLCSDSYRHCFFSLPPSEQRIGLIARARNQNAEQSQQPQLDEAQVFNLGNDMFH